eukprot:TRINITY_DN52137_c0_g1_i1.p1 TRINITY_DN52137_c0_g1~~TRINITY_DN52137_c0_g1_i1.p1  ORF type:complete len:193 (+),score=21.51 TRINITY_DN52137_c0_g1_i1:28-579(+)
MADNCCLTVCTGCCFFMFHALGAIIVLPFVVIVHIPIPLASLLTCIPIFLVTWFTLVWSKRRTIGVKIVCFLLWPIVWVAYLVATLIAPLLLGGMASWDLHNTGLRRCFGRALKRNKHFWRFVSSRIYAKLHEERTNEAGPLERSDESNGGGAFPVLEMGDLLDDSVSSSNKPTTDTSSSFSA